MPQKRKYNPILFAVVLLCCFLISVGVRYQQFETWKTAPSAFFVGDRPMMTTLDAPYWLRWAREYNEGVYQQKNHLRGYPGGTETFKKMIVPKKFLDSPLTSSSSLSSSVNQDTKFTEIKYHDIFLLSFMIAHIAPYFNYNYYLAGTQMIPLLASFFILPLGIYFFRIGVPLCGLLGGLIGTFAAGYYMRSSIGRIDTDMLNLFFPLLASLLILLSSQAKTERSVILYSAGAGLSLFFFQWWYNRPGFTLIYFVVLFLILFVQQIRFRTILFSSLMFVLCVHPGSFMESTGSVQGFLQGYLEIKDSANITEIKNDTAPASFPNTMTTISEVDHLRMEEVLRRILSNPLFDWVGFIALFGLVVLRWRVMLPMFPLLALGLLSFKSSNRFIMYLAPFVGIGLGLILQLGIEAIFLLITKYIYRRGLMTKKEKRKRKVSRRFSLYSLVQGTYLESTMMDTDERGKEESMVVKDPLWSHREIDWLGWARQSVLYLGMGVFFWLISSQTAISFVPSPSIHTGLYATIMEVKKRVPEDSALLTWWDYGYAISDATDLATFHDGGGQQSAITFFIARGLISNEPDELYDIAQYLATEGIEGITEKNTSSESLLAAVRNPKIKPWDPIYLFFTADMTGKYGAISKLGSWDMVNGGSKPRGYQNLACNKITNEEVSCRGTKIDLKAGKINNRVALKRLIFIRNGKVLREQEFGHAQGYTLQLLVVGQQIVEVHLIDEFVFRSNYNQMFLLGRYREDLYEETYNAFPFSRLYRIKY